MFDSPATYFSFLRQIVVSIADVDSLGWAIQV